MSWKTIESHPNYEIDEYGTIRNKKTLHIKKCFLDKYGYCRATFTEGGKTINKSVHRLVLETFVGLPPEGKKEVHHKDGNRANNFVENLQWVSRKENDSYVIHPINSGSYVPVPVEQYSLSGVLLATYKTMSEAARATGCQISKISCVCSGKRKTTGGFIWKRAESSTTNSSTELCEMEDPKGEDIV